MDWKGLDLVVRRKAGRQIRTSTRGTKHCEERGEAIRAAQALGVPYRVTALTVIVGMSPILGTISSPPPPTAPPPLKTKKRKAKSRRQVRTFQRVRRTSRQDIEW